MGIPFARPSIVAYNGYDAGLGNRVRVVLGAKSLANLERREFYYVWPTGHLFGPKLSDLWQFKGKTIPRSFSRALSRVFPYEDQTLEWLNDAKRREHVWQIRTGSPLALPAAAQSWQDEFRALTPVQQISEIVTSFFDENLRDTPYVGVMIRAHSVAHPKTRSASPVDWFVSRMREIQASAPTTRFYVSCDVPSVQEQVMADIPHCVGLTDKGSYNSTAGVRSAVADLYLLASSGHLLGPHWSSFVHLAEHLAGDRLTLETAMTPELALNRRDVSLVKDPLVPSARF